MRDAFFGTRVRPTPFLKFLTLPAHCLQYTRSPHRKMMLTLGLVKYEILVRNKTISSVRKYKRSHIPNKHRVLVNANMLVLRYRS